MNPHTHRTTHRINHPLLSVSATAALFLASALPLVATPFTAQLSSGEVDIEVSSEQEAVDLGRDFPLTMTVTHAADARVDLPDMVALRGRFQGFSLAEGFQREPEKLPDGRVRAGYRWRLVPEPAATYRLAPFAVRDAPLAGAPADARSFATAPAVFPAAALAEASGDPEVSAKPYWIPPTLRSVFLWIGAGVAALVLAALLALLARRLRRAALRRRMSPSERAMAELEDLLARRLPEKGLFKDFYIELTHVVRRYIERSHGIRAPEQTTEEFLAAAKAHPRFTPEVVMRLSRFLRSADLVKFAGQETTSSVADEAVGTARDYISTDAAALRDAELSSAKGGKGGK